jgi:small subunit ribosomal protein S16
MYDIVVADSKSPRDGRFIEKIGFFNPVAEPSKVTIFHERALYWVMTGAQPTDSVRTILTKEGVMLKKHLQVGVLKGAITQEVADERFEAWKLSKLSKEEAIAAEKAKAAAAAKAKLEAEILALREAEAKAKAEEEARVAAEAKAAAEAAAAAEAEAAAATAAEAEPAAEAEVTGTEEEKAS